MQQFLGSLLLTFSEIWTHWFRNFLMWMQSSLIGCIGKNKPGSYIDKQSHNKPQEGKWNGIFPSHRTQLFCWLVTRRSKRSPQMKGSLQKRSQLSSGPCVQKNRNWQRWASPSNTATHVDLILKYIFIVLFCFILFLYSK